LLTVDELCSVQLFGDQHERVCALYPQASDRALLHETVRGMINLIVTDLLEQTAARLDRAQPADIDAVRAQPGPLVTFSDAIYEQHRALKSYLHEKLYRHPRVLEMTHRADKVVAGLFDVYFADPHSMPTEHASRAVADEVEHGDAGRARAVADYVAGMTDRYALSAYHRLVDASLKL
jgi:dGTPase